MLKLSLKHVLIKTTMKTSEAIEIFGSVRGVAEALGLSVQAIYHWGDEVPPLRSYQIRDILDNKQAIQVSEIKQFNASPLPVGITGLPDAG